MITILLLDEKGQGSWVLAKEGSPLEIWGNTIGIEHEFHWHGGTCMTVNTVQYWQDEDGDQIRLYCEEEPGFNDDGALKTSVNFLVDKRGWEIVAEKEYE